MADPGFDLKGGASEDKIEKNLLFGHKKIIGLRPLV